MKVQAGGDVRSAVVDAFRVLVDWAKVRVNPPEPKCELEWASVILNWVAEY